MVVEAIEGRIASTVVIDAPPRHGKSELVSKWLPAWYLMNYPKLRLILASYAADFARGWGRKARDIVNEFAPLLSHRAILSKITSAATDWETISGGGMASAGALGPLTGRGANALIVDDPIKNDKQALSATFRDQLWDWWQSTAETRIEPGGIAIVMATRWHKDDLSGRLLEQARKGDRAPVVHLHLPAIADDACILGRKEGEPLWPERWPIETLEERKRKLDAFWWNALYQGSPVRSGRMEWPDSYFENIYTDTFPDSFEFSVMAVDPSKGRDSKRSDYSSICFLGATGGKLYCEMMMGRWPVEQLTNMTIGCWTKMQPQACFLESNSWQDLLAPEFDRACAEKRLPPMPVQLVHNSTAKETRIGRLGGLLSRNLIKFRRTQSNDMCIKQMKEFPHGDHDDGPDSLEMAVRGLQWLTMQTDDQGDGVSYEVIG